jgi:hypothetical protein
MAVAFCVPDFVFGDVPGTQIDLVLSKPNQCDRAGVIHWGDSKTERRGSSWDELVDQAARMLGIEEPSLLRMRGTPLQILEYFRDKKGSFASLTNWLHLNMQPPDDRLRASAMHSALASLDHCPIIYTTNYDDLLERTMRLAGGTCQ